MTEATRQRERDRDPEEVSFYESTYARMAARRQRSDEGRIVFHRSEIPWQQGRQGKIGYYLHPNITDSAVQDWRVFAHEIHTHSGRHTHQGGLVLYVTKGSGYTVVNGVAEEWGEGDLLLLPVLPGGCEHQHFNDEPDQPSEWVAFIYDPFQYATGSLFEQNENSPNWKG
ncbi:MAG TPA: AraC family ligand binding domain-containing protein [Trebonia sp.]